MLYKYQEELDPESNISYDLKGHCRHQKLFCILQLKGWGCPCNL